MRRSRFKTPQHPLPFLSHSYRKLKSRGTLAEKKKNTQKLEEWVVEWNLCRLARDLKIVRFPRNVRIFTEDVAKEFLNGTLTHKLPLKCVSLVAYVAEDGLVGHQWEERPLVLWRLYAPIQENSRARKQECVDWGAGWGEVIGNFWDNIWNVKEENI